MKKHLFLFVVLLLTGFISQAQNRCFKAYDRFGREVTKFCVGERITFRDCAGVDADKEYYDYDKRDGLNFNAPEATQKYYTFTSPGPVTVTQLGNLNGVTDQFEQTFEVVATPALTYSTTACANKTFLVSITDNNYDFYIVRFINSNNITEYSQTVYSHQTGTPVKFTYTGTPKEITVTGSYSGAFCTSQAISYSVSNLAAYTPATISQATVLRQDATAGEVRLTVSGFVQGYRYTLEQRVGAAYQVVRTIATTDATQTIANINTTVPQQFRITATDACNQTLPTSNIVTTIPLTVGGGNEQATLNWQTIAGTFQQFDVYRNGVLQQSFPGVTTSYTDADVNCGQQYCYEIRGKSADGKSVSISAQSCISVTSTKVPPAPPLYATFNLQNQVELTLQLPAGDVPKSIVYQRSLNGAAYATLTTTTDVTITDNPGTRAPACYQATYTNACNITSTPSAAACPVLLTVTKNPDETVVLTWTNYSGFAGGVANYSLELLDERGNVISSKTVQGNRHTEQLADQQEQVFRYRIKATSRNGEVTYSNNETIKLELALFIPSGFTPNGDGLNDLFEVKGKRFESFALRVLNGAGQVVFTSADRNIGWDGTYNGKPQPAGVYAYEVTVKLQDGSTRRLTGTVTLLR